MTSIEHTTLFKKHAALEQAVEAEWNRRRNGGVADAADEAKLERQIDELTDIDDAILAEEIQSASEIGVKLKIIAGLTFDSVTDELRQLTEQVLRFFAAEAGGA